MPDAEEIVGGITPEPKIPLLTPPQYLILKILSEQKGEMQGRHLNEKLFLQHAIKYTGPHFYLAMGRLEDEGLVTSAKHEVTVGGQVYKPMSFAITSLGELAIEKTIEKVGQERLDEYAQPNPRRHFIRRLIVSGISSLAARKAGASWAASLGVGAAVSGLDEVRYKAALEAARVDKLLYPKRGSHDR